MTIDIIGAGFSGLVAACYLSKEGHQVIVHEKHDKPGGRARNFKTNGFTFDMGPSWYWMPEIMENIFADMGKNIQDYLSIERLDPAYKVFWKNDESTSIPADMADLYNVFDGLEPNGGQKLKDFLSDAELKYTIGTQKFLEKPGLKLTELLDSAVFKNFFKLDIFKSVEKDVCNRFSSHKARSILRFPVLFLGEMPNRIPSLYTMMNYADLKLGTWYPKGGMYSLAVALMQVAESFGATFNFNANAEQFECEDGRIKAIQFSGHRHEVNQVIASADYNFVEQQLIPEKYRRYSPSYWDKKKFAPSSLLWFLGVDKINPGLEHHNLFFDEDLIEHGKQIYEAPSWPDSPLFYACVTSRTEPETAPEGCDNLFLLMPLATNVEDNEALRNKYLKIMLDRIKKHTGVDVEPHLIYKKSYCIDDFKADYNAYKGNAYGLANTLMQTANLKPKITSKLENLLFCGQLTVPGPGVPPALISGKIAAKLTSEKIKNKLIHS